MVHFVSAGPGALDLITLRAKNLVEKAEVLVYAGSLVNPQLLTYAKSSCRVYNSAKMTLDETTKVLADADKEGLFTVRLHTGDTSVYSAIHEQIDRLDELGIEYDVTPGVSAFQAAAAALNAELTLPGVSQSVTITRISGRTATPGRESVRSFARHHATLCLYLSSSKAEDLKAELLAGGYEPGTPVCVVYRASWPDQKMIRTTVDRFPEKMREDEIDRTAVILVGDVLEVGRKAVESRLYSGEFTDGCREAKKKRYVFFGCSAQGCRQMREAAEWIREKEPDTAVKTIVKSKSVDGFESRSILDLTGDVFAGADLLVYFGAVGIAVRSIAPFVRSKAEDPAVLVIDSRAEYCIPILSGHLGKANKYAAMFAEKFGAEAVITTATDLENHFAVDSWADNNGLKIVELKRIRDVSSAVIEGKVVPVWMDEGITIGDLPQELRVIDDRSQAKIIISVKRDASDRGDAMHLVPHTVSAGVGCRRGASKEEILHAVKTVMAEKDIRSEALAGLASIDVKKDEAGLLEAAAELNVPVHFYTAGELNSLKGTFSSSDFVENTVGTDCVCERSSVKDSGAASEKRGAENGGNIAGKLIVSKTVCDHVTVALAVPEMTVLD